MIGAKQSQSLNLSHRVDVAYVLCSIQGWSRRQEHDGRAASLILPQLFVGLFVDVGYKLERQSLVLAIDNLGRTIYLYKSTGADLIPIHRINYWKVIILKIHRGVL